MVNFSKSLSHFPCADDFNLFIEDKRWIFFKMKNQQFVVEEKKTHFIHLIKINVQDSRVICIY